MRLITVASALLFSGILSGQTITCSLNAGNVPVRGEGQAELIGDIILQCTQSRPGTATTVWHRRQNGTPV
jgi:hypothetical protein